MYAIIETGGKQYKVCEGDIIKVEKLNVEAGTELKLDKVLMISNDDNLNIGSPYLSDASVMSSVIGNGKHKKVIIYKYKSKKGFHKKKGHRQQFTELKIEKISL